jgi:hypothetical protein
LRMVATATAPSHWRATTAAPLCQRCALGPPPPPAARPSAMPTRPRPVEETGWWRSWRSRARTAVCCPPPPPPSTASSASTAGSTATTGQLPTALPFHAILSLWRRPGRYLRRGVLREDPDLPHLPLERQRSAARLFERYVRKRGSFAPFDRLLETIGVPRQAQGKHGESTQRGEVRVFLQGALGRPRPKAKSRRLRWRGDPQRHSILALCRVRQINTPFVCGPF